MKIAVCGTTRTRFIDDLRTNKRLTLAILLGLPLLFPLGLYDVVKEWRADR